MKQDTETRREKAQFKIAQLGGHCSWTHWFWCPEKASNIVDQQVVTPQIPSECPIILFSPTADPIQALSYLENSMFIFIHFFNPLNENTCSNILKKQSIKIWKILALHLIHQNNHSGYNKLSKPRFSLLSSVNIVSACSL